MLHETLAADCVPVTDLKLCRVLLMDDARFPWLILVPMQQDLGELFDLGAADRALLTEEISHVSGVLKRLFKADKMNIAMLGNQVPQLHAHVIVRFRNDAGWPSPVWSCTTPRKRYAQVEQTALIARLRGAL